MFNIQEYFDAWNNKDLKKLKVLFHKEIIISDWNGVVVGLDSSIAFNSKLFVDIPGIHAELIRCDSINNIFYCILKVHIENEILDVIDVIEVHNGYITSITAFKK